MADGTETTTAAGATRDPTDLFDNARENLRGKEDPNLDGFLVQWFLEEIRLLEANRRRDQMRAEFMRIWDPRSTTVFESMRAVSLHLTLLSAEFEWWSRHARFVAYPWVFPMNAALALQGVHAGVLAYWLSSVSSDSTGDVPPDLRSYVDTAVRTTVAFLGRSPSA